MDTRKPFGTDPSVLHFYRTGKEELLYKLAKRSIDVCGALFGIVLFSPVLLIVAICIKVEDPKGPVIYSQDRIGHHGRAFRMYKFRSMVVNADELLKDLQSRNEGTGPLFKMKNDPRITTVGRWIRKTSLDELPQLWNVIKGDMSLVGPRPALPSEVKEYTQYHKLRLCVVPGCTGLWQVSGRSELSFEEMVELDLVYIRERSLWMDLVLILKTLVVMIRPNGAY